MEHPSDNQDDTHESDHGLLARADGLEHGPVALVDEQEGGEEEVGANESGFDFNAKNGQQHQQNRQESA